MLCSWKKPCKLFNVRQHEQIVVFRSGNWPYKLYFHFILFHLKWYLQKSLENGQKQNEIKLMFALLDKAFCFFVAHPLVLLKGIIYIKAESFSFFNFATIAALRSEKKNLHNILQLKFFKTDITNHFVLFTTRYCSRYRLCEVNKKKYCLCYSWQRSFLNMNKIGPRCYFKTYKISLLYNISYRLLWH